MSNSTGAPPNSYDEMDYPFYAHRLTHPSHLGMAATLMGMNPAPVDRCRVLEIGCAAGGNLIPMAYTLPQASFMGVDLSERQIARGRQIVEEFGLHNIQLLDMDLLDIDETFGLFDYIIAHGVYSWAPPAVQDGLLGVIRRNLSPDGVAWVSYNTLPGWGLRRTLREMTLYHLRGVNTPNERIDQALSFLDFLSRDVKPQTFPAYRDYLTQAVQSIAGLDFKSDDRTYYYHEDLEDLNVPLYFYQFIEHAAQHGLKYLAEAEIHSMTPYEFDPETVQTIQGFVHDQIEFEQYLDFLRNRMFRQTLLCHGEARQSGMLTKGRLDYLKFAACLNPAGALDLTGDSAGEFVTPSGQTLTLTMPIQKAAFLFLLQIYPHAATVDEIFRGACSLLAEHGGAYEIEDRQHISSVLLAVFLYANAVEFTAWQPPFAPDAGQKPTASAWARWQAQHGSRVTNLLHGRVDLTPVERQLLILLDGWHGRDTLLVRLNQWAAGQGMGEPVQAVQVDTMLDRFARQALLEMQPDGAS